MTSTNPVTCASGSCPGAMEAASPNRICVCSVASRSVASGATCACPTNSSALTNICECNAGYIEITSYPLVCAYACPIFAESVSTAYTFTFSSLVYSKFTCSCSAGYKVLSNVPLVCVKACPTDTSL